MPRQLPDFVEPMRLAEAGARMQGTLPLGGFRRLAPMLAGPEGEVSVRLAFDLDEDGRPVLTGSADAECRVVCQRCMEVMRLPLHADLSLGLVRGEQEGERLPARYEPLIVGAGGLRTADIVEDELILALPFAPRHAPGQCRAAGGAQPPQQAGHAPRDKGESPFSVLAALKHGKHD